MREGLSRRAFLGGAAGAAAAGMAAPALVTRPAGATDGPPDGPASEYLEFYGEHQTGITARAPASGLMAAFDTSAANRNELTEAFRALSAESARLMTGVPYDERDSAYPPVYSGTVGNPPPAADLSVIVAVGASLFDGRYGLAPRKPRELVSMPFLANDRLDPAITHGDVLLTISADTPDVCIFALRQLMRQTRGALVLRWMLDGFNRHDQAGRGACAGAQSDGIQGRHREPRRDRYRVRWTDTCGSGQVTANRRGRSAVPIRRCASSECSWNSGTAPPSPSRRRSSADASAAARRSMATGRPTSPTTRPIPRATRTPLDAHIRLANPRTQATKENLILRRGFSYSRGFDRAGRLDQGLAFVSFQRSLERGFLTVQARLSGEPLEEYILPVGGGFFFALPGASGRDTYLGRGLLA